MADYYEDWKDSKAAVTPRPAVLTEASVIDSLVSRSYETAVEHGWWDEERSVGDLIALMHSELSEALEEFRSGHAPAELYYEGDKPEGVPAELADVLIRIFDFCGAHGVDLAEALVVKMRYNASRPFRHGGKVL